MWPKRKKCTSLTFLSSIIVSNYDDRLSVKGHTLANKEREILLREQGLINKEQHLA